MLSGNTAEKQGIRRLKIVLPIFLFSGCLAFLICTSFSNAGSPDEAFYLTVPYRLIHGDCFLVHEWYAAQFVGFLQYLPVRFFLRLTGSMDGIVVFSRCLFSFCQVCVGCFCFLKLKKYNYICALLSALLFCLYMPETLPAIDYYTVSIHVFAVISVIVYTEDEPKPHLSFFCGVLLACGVLAQPFTAVLYFIWTAAVLMINVKKTAAGKWFSAGCWFFFTLGVIAVAGVFLAFVARRCSLKLFFESLPNIVKVSDHTLSFFSETGALFSYSKLAEVVFEIMPVSLLLSLPVTGVLLFDKKRNARKTVWCVVFLCVLLINIFEIAGKIGKLQYAALYYPVPLFLAGTWALILSRSGKNKKKTVLLWAAGPIYIFLIGITSQALEYIFPCACIVSVFACLLAFGSLFSERSTADNEDPVSENGKKPVSAHGGKKRIGLLQAVVSVCVCFSLIAGTTLLTKRELVSGALRDDVGLPEVQSRIEVGPLKGIKVPYFLKSVYNNLYDDIVSIPVREDEKLLIAGLMPWGYLCVDSAPAVFTAWSMSADLHLYEEYYRSVGSIPTWIYVPDDYFYISRSKVIQQELIKEFESLFVFSVEEGKEGLILHVEKALFDY